MQIWSGAVAVYGLILISKHGGPSVIHNPSAGGSKGSSLEAQPPASGRSTKERTETAPSTKTVYV